MGTNGDASGFRSVFAILFHFFLCVPDWKQRVRLAQEIVEKRGVKQTSPGVYEVFSEAKAVKRGRIRVKKANKMRDRPASRRSIDTRASQYKTCVGALNVFVGGFANT